MHPQHQGATEPAAARRQAPLHGLAPVGSRDALKSLPWFGQTASSPRSSGRFSVVVRSAIGIAAGLIFVGFGKPILGAIIAGIALIIGFLSLASTTARSSIDRFFERLGQWLAKAVSWVILAPLFLIGFTLVRGWMRLTGADPLQLQSSSSPTYWLEADHHQRKVRYASAMFATERLRRRGLSRLAALTLLVVAVIVSEGALRFLGFGSPVLYVTDPLTRFHPAPNQEIVRYGGRVEINEFGMRAPAYAAEKPAGTFRVLMIGDSTLYGGSYIDQDELYSRRLESHLRNAAGGRPVEILAIGVNAWGPFHKIGYIEKFGTFGADLAIINLPIQDIYRPHYGIEKVPFHTVKPRLALEEIVTHLAWRIRATSAGPMTAEETAYHSERGVEAYARLAAMLRSKGAEVMFQVLPTQSAATGGAIPVEEARDVQRLRDAVVPTQPAAFSFPSGLFRDTPGDVYHDVAHLDVAGHRVYSEFLLNEVVSRSRKWNEWTAASAGAHS